MMQTGEVPSDFRRPGPGWGNTSAREPRWPATTAIFVALVFYVLLPNRLIYAPFGLSSDLARWVIPALEIMLVLPLTLSTPHHRLDREESRRRRIFSTSIIGLVNLANLASLILLVDRLVNGKLHKGGLGLELLYSAVLIWLTNVIIFSLWYWELDRGGPGARCQPVHREPDFLFPQMINPSTAPEGWTPTFFDYLYVSFTNAAAFSPTDTLPLTEMSKSLMLIQSLASLVIIALVAARAVNILGS